VGKAFGKQLVQLTEILFVIVSVNVLEFAWHNAFNLQKKGKESEYTHIQLGCSSWDYWKHPFGCANQQ